MTHKRKIFDRKKIDDKYLKVDLALVEGKVVCKQGLKVGWKGSDAKSTASANELSLVHC